MHSCNDLNIVCCLCRREHLSEDDIKSNKLKLDHGNLQKALSQEPGVSSYLHVRNVGPVPEDCVLFAQLVLVLLKVIFSHVVLFLDFVSIVTPKD